MSMSVLPAALLSFSWTPPRSEGGFVDKATDPALASLAVAIARCRRRCWEIEHAVFGARIAETPFSPRGELEPPPPSPEALDQVRALKELLGLLVAARGMSGGRMPPDATLW